VIKSPDVEDPVNLHVHRPLQLLLARPLAWAFGDTRTPVPWAALGANAQWNLATNSVLALALAAAELARR